MWGTHWQEQGKEEVGGEQVGGCKRKGHVQEKGQGHIEPKLNQSLMSLLPTTSCFP